MIIDQDQFTCGEQVFQRKKIGGQELVWPGEYTEPG